MGTRTEYAPGTFSWVDLTTNNPAAAKDFYGGLFGWEFEDSEIPGGGAYTMCEVGGEHVCAITSSNDEVAPHWNSYVTVASADESAARAKELGATMIEEPFDVMSAGRMAVFQDPTGAALCLWQASDQIGAGRVNEPGCFTWNELHARDPSGGLEFYSALFGWTSEKLDTPEEGREYLLIRNGERTNGGAVTAIGDEPPSWVPSFVGTGRDSAEKAKERGGEELTRIELPMGKMTVLRDPQGAAFALWDGELDD